MAPTLAQMGDRLDLVELTVNDSASASAEQAVQIETLIHETHIKIVAQRPADILPDKRLSVMENLLQSQDQIDGVYTHDDMAERVVSASAINLARLLARGEALDELAEPEVPSRIQVPATPVTKENVASVKELGY
jgi:ABC-type sugar transport system substrate-binding protein